MCNGSGNVHGEVATATLRAVASVWHNSREAQTEITRVERIQTAELARVPLEQSDPGNRRNGPKQPHIMVEGWKP